MNILRKTFSIIMGLTMILSSYQVNGAESLEDPPKTITVFAGQKVTAITYNDREILGTSAWYINSDGKKMPAYCIDPHTPGVGAIDERQYDVNIAGANMDTKIAGVLLSGYPYKSLAELGGITEEEAYSATKAAVWSVLNNTPYPDINAWASINPKALQAMNQIISDGETVREC